MEQPIFSVSQLLGAINQTLEYAYPTVVVEGEIASFKISKNKYVFYDIKDADAAISCFMMIYQLRQPLEDGMKVRLIAQPRLTAWGKFSLTVREVLPVGEGSIKRAFDLLRAQLESEGLFDPARKRHLPSIPERVGLIASVESAGYADFIKIINQRWGGLEIQVADVHVQGQAAADQITGAINYFNQQAKPPEAIILIRGGGSADDLAVFNDSNLARAVAASRVPTMVGVGHETDTSLCDLAADVRASTPSNAAQLLVPDRAALLAQLSSSERSLADRITQHAERLHIKVDNTTSHMTYRMQYQIEEQKRHLGQVRRVLDKLDPHKVLRRGYSLVRNQQGAVVRGLANGLKPGDLLTITTSHAIIRSGVIDVQRIKAQ